MVIGAYMIVMSRSWSLLVGANARGFQRLRAQLLQLVRDKMHAERELIHTGTLPPKVEDADLGIGHTTIEPRLGIWLQGKRW